MQGKISTLEQEFFEDFKKLREKFYYPERNPEFWRQYVDEVNDVLSKYEQESFFPFASNLVFSEMTRQGQEIETPEWERHNPSFVGVFKKGGIIRL